MYNYQPIKLSEIKPGMQFKVVNHFCGGTTQTTEGIVEEIVRVTDGPLNSRATYAKFVGVPYVPWTPEEIAAWDYSEMFAVPMPLELPTTKNSVVLLRNGVVVVRSDVGQGYNGERVWYSVNNSYTPREVARDGERVLYIAP